MISDASKFDDDPWPISQDQTHQIDPMTQMSQSEACQMFDKLRDIYESRMIVGTTDVNSTEYQWQKMKFASLNDYEKQ